MASKERLVARRAKAQHGLITRLQLAESGFNTASIARAVRAGRLERLHPGIYRTWGAVPTWEQQALAAVLHAQGVVSHRSAARVWNLLASEQIEVTVGRAQHPRTRGVVVHRSGDLGPHHVTRRNGLTVTTPMRTLVDLGAVTGRHVVTDALELALVHRVCSLRGIERALDDIARRGRAGAGVLRHVLDDRALGATRPDGLLEPRLARVLRDHGLPQPVFQYEVRGPSGRLLARVDAAYPDQRLAIEVDGFEVHGTPSALQHDLERQNRLVAAGWTVLRFTWPDVVQRPASVAGRVGDVLWLSRGA
jgi:very-short-patch-repair endonuclease